MAKLVSRCRRPCRPNRVGVLADGEGDAAAGVNAAAVFSPHLRSSAPAVRLTVWCRSLLFNGEGYTVYDDSDGRMLFRVDNYAQNWREEAHLMDPVGNVLLTVRRRSKKFRMTESWEVYEGDYDVLSRSAPAGGARQKPLFRVTKALGSPSCAVSAVSRRQEGAGAGPDYRMSWSRRDERSRIFAAGPVGSPPVAEVFRKFCVAGGPPGTLGKDVRSMEVRPGIDPVLVMALLMINDAM